MSVPGGKKRKRRKICPLGDTNIISEGLGRELLNTDSSGSRWSCAVTTPGQNVLTFRGCDGRKMKGRLADFSQVAGANRRKNVINYSTGWFLKCILYIKHILWRLVAQRSIMLFVLMMSENSAGKLAYSQQAIRGVGLKLGLTRLWPFSWGFISSTRCFGPV